MVWYAIMQLRHFPPLWPVEQHDSCFVVHDPRWQSVGYFYFDHDPARTTAGSLSRDEARRMAANFANLPQLLHRDSPA